ncbi:beta-lactamase hydrolase domain-containing protein [Peristeroidobacter agariperforans]|uniref:beta-lactamase hydrolase domain-containing protein n=1 Tax=Peristeroidobacter agariperforans TaxID=268404 RepID=UPI00101C1424|nr:sulfur transferase domain-containing protein [Peristeroidobacter agariperforans]
MPQVAAAVSPSPGIIAAGRLKPEDIAQLNDAGIEHVIDLTPDDETPDFDEANAVRSAGINYSNLPVRGAADLTRENAIAFDRMMRNAKRPVLVHCASGNRVGAIAALRAAWLEGQSEEDAIAIGKTWGLKGLEPEVRERIRSLHDSELGSSAREQRN